MAILFKAHRTSRIMNNILYKLLSKALIYSKINQSNKKSSDEDISNHEDIEI